MDEVMGAVTTVQVDIYEVVWWENDNKTNLRENYKLNYKNRFLRIPH